MPRKIIEGSVRPVSYSSGLREIVSPTGTSENQTGKICPDCGGALCRGLVPCPNGHIGCMTAHYGYICSTCGKTFT